MAASPVQQAFVTQLAARTGLAPAVVENWVSREGAYAPNGTGHYNFLNLRPATGGTSYSGVPLAGVSSGNFSQFPSLTDAVTETAYWLNKMPNYQGIRDAVKAGANPDQQWKAITTSPWDSGHYGQSGLPTATVPTPGTVASIAPSPTVQPMTAPAAAQAALTLTSQKPSSPLADPVVQQIVTSNDRLLGFQAPDFAALPQLQTKVSATVAPQQAPPLAQPKIQQTSKHVTTGSTGQLTFQIKGHETPSAQNAISLAEDYLGTPYVWGGESPKGFDCSGLLQYVWSRAGVQIPRTTYDQFKQGTPVTKSQLQPGDAVFFTGSDPRNGLPGHVAMYIGNGKVIQAPHTGADVEITNLNSIPNFQGGRRYA